MSVSPLLRIWLPVSLAVHITLFVVLQGHLLYRVLPIAANDDDTIQIVQLPPDEPLPPEAPLPKPPKLDAVPTLPEAAVTPEVTKSPIAETQKTPVEVVPPQPSFKKTTAPEMTPTARQIMLSQSSSPIFTPPPTGDISGKLPDSPATPILPRPGQLDAPNIAGALPQRMSLEPPSPGDGVGVKGEVTRNQQAPQLAALGRASGINALTFDNGGNATALAKAGLPSGGGDINFAAPPNVMTAQTPTPGAPLIGNFGDRPSYEPTSSFSPETVGRNPEYAQVTGAKFGIKDDSARPTPVDTPAGPPSVGQFASADVPQLGAPAREENMPGFPATSLSGTEDRRKPTTARPTYAASLLKGNYLPPTSMGPKEKCQGTVKLSFAVTVDGNCDSIQITDRCEYDTLNNYSIYLMEKKIQFNPPMKNGEVVRSENMHCQIVFTLDKMPDVEMLP